MLTIRGICKSFEGRPVLEDVSFDFPEAAVTALRGPSGCGKTTLVNIILGLIEPDAGDVLMPASARTAAVFQEDRLIEHFSAARNVRLTAPASVTDEQIRSALSELGLAQEGEKRVSEFSGGMRRRVAVIRAALFQPQFLLLDEPFKGLDEEMRERTAAFLRRNCAQATTILVTHDETEAALMGATAELDLGGKEGS
ncbi:MAG TPA: ATP-binding cassette domain-containing protein [Candidatus Pullichristensenella excrementipullorum]|nr:ATP-binding cassette domain-containing protein [Candidatus Pullichristensenella excrementipullorum]